LSHFSLNIARLCTNSDKANLQTSCNKFIAMEGPWNLAKLHPNLLQHIFLMCAPSRSIGFEGSNEMSIAFVCKKFYKLYMEKHVTTLDLSSLPHFPEPSDLTYVSSTLKSVTAIDLRYCPAAMFRFHAYFRQSDAMQAWTRNIKSLACTLDMPDDDPVALWVTDSVMHDVFATIPYEDGRGLTSIIFDANMALRDEGLWAICANAGCRKNLIHLDLSETNISDDGATSLKNLLALQTLHLNSCKRLRTLTFQGLSHLKNMRTLYLANTHLDRMELYNIVKGMPHLEELDVQNTSDMTDWNEDGGTQHFSILEHLPKNISLLGMSTTGLTNVGMSALVARCRTLKHLFLILGSNFNDLSLLAPICTNLQSLSLLDVEDMVVCSATIKLMQNITSLHFSTCHRVDLPAMDEILGLPKLEFCRISSVLIPENAFRRLAKHLEDCRFGIHRGMTKLIVSSYLEMNRTELDRAGRLLRSGTRQAVQSRYQQALNTAQLETLSSEWVQLIIAGAA
jgi:hypothetical protein